MIWIICIISYEGMITCLRALEAGWIPIISELLNEMDASGKRE